MSLEEEMEEHIWTAEELADAGFEVSGYQRGHREIENAIELAQKLRAHGRNARLIQADDGTFLVLDDAKNLVKLTD